MPVKLPREAFLEAHLADNVNGQKFLLGRPGRSNELFGRPEGLAERFWVNFGADFLSNGEVREPKMRLERF